MRIRKAEFITSAVSPEHYPPLGPPEIALVGRSNVGKSSLLNHLTQRKSLAITSRAPGRTRLVNFFDINGRLRLVDLPGYGYAKAPKSEREKWREMAENYLTRRDSLVGVVLLIDIRHDLSPLDMQIFQYLAAQEIPCIVAFTKADKLNKSKQFVQLRRLKDQLGIQGNGVLMYSIKMEDARKTLWKSIADLLETPFPELMKPA